jgi:hypothetical protein
VCESPFAFFPGTASSILPGFRNLLKYGQTFSAIAVFVERCLKTFTGIKIALRRLIHA